MENVIKQSEECRNRALDTAKRIHEEYRPLKMEIDRMRREYLGLERLPELHEEERDLITPEYVFLTILLAFYSHFLQFCDISYKCVCCIVIISHTSIHKSL